MGTNLGRVGDLFDRIGNGVTRAAAQGAAANVLTQGIATATGLQHKFDWTGVAVAAVSSGTARTGSAFPALSAASGDKLSLD